MNDMARARPSKEIQAIEPTRSRLLLIESDGVFANFLQDYLSEIGYAIIPSGDPTEAISLARQHKPDIILCDHRPPSLDGLQLIRRLHDAAPNTIIIATSSLVTADIARMTLEAGAVAFLAKPFHALQVDMILKQYRQERNLFEELQELRDLHDHRHFLGELIGGSPPMRSLYQLLDAVAVGDIPALVVGEPGTEKTAVARTMHMISPRSRGPLVELNLETEHPGVVAEKLFGSTSVYRSEPSAFDQAEGGSLLIAEVGRLSLDAQRRLLDILQERALTRAGAARPRRLDVRLLVTSTDDLVRLVEEDRFLRDLYYRINVAQVMVPSLHERLEDIPMLAMKFLKRANKQLNMRVEGLSLETLMTLITYRWPNNVAELQDVIVKGCRACERGVMTAQHLPIDVYRAASELSEGESVANVSFKQAKGRFELQYFTDLLRKTRGNMTQAAELSKVGRPYLYKKLREHNLRPAEFRQGRPVSPDELMEEENLQAMADRGELAGVDTLDEELTNEKYK